MATVNLSPLFNGVTSFDAYGQILAGGQLYCYQAGSSTPLATYTTSSGNIANSNPIILGTDGKLPNEMWLQYGYSYKFILQTASSVTVDTYDNIAGILTQVPTSSTVVPSGCILIWSGSTGSIPSGFVLCNGANGTPDLRNSFILGAGNSYTVGQTGGSTDSIIVSHTHTATSTVTDPGHLHYAGGAGAAAGGANPVRNTTDVGSTVATTTATTGITVATSNTTTGVSGTNANMPPYYALAYIQKT